MFNRKFAIVFTSLLAIIFAPMPLHCATPTDIVTTADTLCLKGQFAEAETILLNAQKSDNGQDITRINQTLAQIYYDWGDDCIRRFIYRDALTVYEKLLAIDIKSVNKKYELADLGTIGFIYSKLSQYDKALEYYQKSLDLAKQSGDILGEALGLANIGVVYLDLARFDKALEYGEKALDIAVKIGDKRIEAGQLANIGAVYKSLFQFDKALEYYRKALAIDYDLSDKRAEESDYSRMGDIYEELRQYHKAIECFQNALLLDNEVGDKGLQANTLGSIGILYKDLSQYDKAQENFRKALSINTETGNKPGIEQCLCNIGNVYSKQSQEKKALQYYQKGLLIQREIHDNLSEAQTLNNIMNSYQKLGKPVLAIFYGKQSVNLFQTIRSDVRNMDKSLQKSYLNTYKVTYRTLADLLISAGRLSEAQQVLDTLKEEEFNEFVRRDAGYAAGVQSGVQSGVTIRGDEAEWQKQYNKIAENVTEIGLRYDQLLDKQRLLAKTNESLSSDEVKELDSLDRDLQTANKAFQAFLDNLANTPDNRRGKASATAEALSDASALSSTLKQLGHGAVALYTVVEPDKYLVIVVTPQTQKAEQYTIKTVELNNLVFNFKTALANPKLDPRPLGNKLYKILIGPIEKDLDGAQAKTLMWSLDGVLRYIPVAALYDGKHYLAERYANEIFTGASTSNFLAEVSSRWSAAGFGVSHGSIVTGSSGEKLTFDPLPGAELELKSVIKTTAGSSGVLPGTMMIDDQFTLDTFKSTLREGKYPLVHIASHFAFRPGDDRSSFLLMGKGDPLTLCDIKNLQKPFQGVELLTLSACNTASSGSRNADGREMDSLGIIAQRQGALSVIATLWQVSDQGTQQFMAEFYRLHEGAGKPTKAEALQQAQIALIRGSSRPVETAETRSRSINLAPPNEQDANKPVYINDPNAPYSHPYYWAAFILIGNWR